MAPVREGLTIPPYYEEFKKNLRATAPLSDEAIELIRPYVTFHTFRKNEVAYREGHVCRTILMLRKGIMRSYMKDKGSEITRWFAVEGQVFTAVTSFSTDSPSLSTVEAVTRCEAWEIRTQLAKQMIGHNEEWRVWLLKTLLVHMEDSEKRDHNFISSDAYTRFKSLTEASDPGFINQIPLTVLASYLHITPRTLARCRTRRIHEKTKK